MKKKFFAITGIVVFAMLVALNVNTIYKDNAKAGVTFITAEASAQYYYTCWNGYSSICYINTCVRESDMGINGDQWVVKCDFYTGTGDPVSYCRDGQDCSLL